LRRGGYTLVELVVVLAILGVLFGIGVGALMHYLQIQRLRAAAEVVKSTAVEARNRAGVESVGYRLAVCDDHSLAYAPEGGDACSTGTRRTLPYRARVELKNATCDASAALLRFSGRGLPLAQRCLEVTYAGRVRRVVVLLSGKVEVP
jgi:prepilin-type N-terminal cleavage/methylation domain-containing protein